MTHLDEHKLLSDRQHAFQKKHSCETQLITVIDDRAKILDKGVQVDTFILDFEKAFDTPPLEQLKWKSLKKRRKVSRLIMLYKGLKGVASIPTNDLVPPIRHTRNRHSLAFQIPMAGTDIYKSSFFPQII